jgi:hypothetical protein
MSNDDRSFCGAKKQLHYQSIKWPDDEMKQVDVVAGVNGHHSSINQCHHQYRIFFRLNK